MCDPNLSLGNCIDCTKATCANESTQCDAGYYEVWRVSRRQVFRDGDKWDPNRVIKTENNTDHFSVVTCQQPTKGGPITITGTAFFIPFDDIPIPKEYTRNNADRKQQLFNYLNDLFERGDNAPRGACRLKSACPGHTVAGETVEQLISGTGGWAMGRSRVTRKMTVDKWDCCNGDGDNCCESGPDTTFTRTADP